MDFLSEQFLVSLATIVVIDLLLAGDNAIVIALAARALPAEHRRRAVAWGTVGAVAVRALMSLVVVWLLAIPGLLLIGGVALLWISYKLLLPGPLSPAGHSLEPAGRATGFWGAMRTIVIADAVMGVDNVLGVAGAAQGSYLLVVIGLALSVPIMVWGSGLVMRAMERFPFIVYVGAAVLAWTAVGMIASEPFVAGLLAKVKPHRVALIYILVVGGVLFAGLVRTHRKYADYGLPATLGTAIAVLLRTLLG
ncbi:MAG: TerC family protein [Usitatibacter sp.]